MVLTPVVGSYFGQHKSVLSTDNAVDKTGQRIFDNISQFYSDKIKVFVHKPFETIIHMFSII